MKKAEDASKKIEAASDKAASAYKGYVMSDSKKAEVSLPAPVSLPAHVEKTGKRQPYCRCLRARQQGG